MKAEYVELGQFITVVSSIVALILGGFWILVSKLMGLKERVATVENQNLSDIKNIDDIWDSIKETNNKMNSLNEQRAEDVKMLTSAIHKLDMTLGKMEVTLENINNRNEDRR